jgi:hypothetical protein
VPSVDVVDETFVVVPPEVLAAEFATPDRWRALWPDLDLEVITDRGAAGFRWTVTGALVGSMEVWLEPVRAAKAIALACKDRLEAGRAAGEPPAR